MFKMIALFAVTTLLLVGGCKSDDNGNMQGPGGNRGSEMNVSTDACKHCPGMQTATSNGKCPICNANVQ